MLFRISNNLNGKVLTTAFSFDQNYLRALFRTVIYSDGLVVATICFWRLLVVVIV